MSPFWTPEEDNLIRSMKKDGRCTDEIAARLPNRTRRAVQIRMHALEDASFKPRRAVFSNPKIRDFAVAELTRGVLPGALAKVINQQFGVKVHEDTVRHFRRTVGLGTASATQHGAAPRRPEPKAVIVFGDIAILRREYRHPVPSSYGEGDRFVRISLSGGMVPA